MQTQDTSTFVFLKLWPWMEANVKRIGVVVGIAVVAAFLISFYFWEQNQKEIAASQALTQLIVSTPPDTNPGQLADSYLQIASTHPGTLAAQRALLQGATELFAAGRYADAQAQFEKFLNAHPNGQFLSQAALGVAASLEAQDKMNLAADAYQKVINEFSDPLAADSSKFALAGIYESQGRASDALSFYEDVARANPNNSLGSEARLRAMELRTKQPPTAPATVTAPSRAFNLIH